MITYTQAQVDSAVTYLMHGGPNGGELTSQQYDAMVRMFVYPGSSSEQPAGTGPLPGMPWGHGRILTTFAWQIQLAINQGHSGLAGSRNICRDKWGALNDAYMSGDGGDRLGPADRLGMARSDIQDFNVSISG